MSDVSSPREGSSRPPWVLLVIMALSVGIGALMLVRPDKVHSEPLPEGLAPGDPVILEVLAQHDGADETLTLRRDGSLPVGARVRLRVTVSEVSRITAGVLTPTGRWTAALTSTELPPGVHTILKTFTIPGEGFDAMVGTPDSLQALQRGEPSTAKRIRLKAGFEAPAAE